MVRDAETHAKEDELKRELIEVRNKAESLIYTTEKSLKEYGDKIDASDKTNIESTLENLKEAAKTEDKEKINSLCEELSQASMKIGEAMYKDQQQGASNEGNADSSSEDNSSSKENNNSDEKVVDAEFEEIKDDKDKKDK